MVRCGANSGPFRVTRISGRVVLDPSVTTGPDKVSRASAEPSARSVPAVNDRSAPCP